MLDSLTVHMNDVPIYDISYNNSFDGLSQLLTNLGSNDKKICIVSDSKVASCYMDAILRVTEPVAKSVISFVFPEGEPSKNLDTVKQLYETLILAKFDRHDLLIALGGGVVGDLTGYGAATYLRGIDFVQIPTSLLAQVDSSIGGKTGVDFDSYKNMVGAFHMPKLVYMNFASLNTLDRRQFFSGMGEIAKSALIRDGAFFDWLEENISGITTLEPEALATMVYKCNIVKKNVVENDPTEKGERALLNFGHTLGHAIEKFMDFRYLHGECVSIGCIMASILSYNKGLIDKAALDRIIGLIRQFELPHLTEELLDMDKVIAYTKNDKKMQGSSIKFILLNSIGDAFISTEVTDQDMLQSMKDYLALGL
jgi:3-dehydroquinate synthase